MALTWLHLSDFHIRAGDTYDRDVVLGALVESVRRYRERGRRPDVVFTTGDVANSGQAAEYALATAFFDDLLEAAGLERPHLFVIPGNHDVDRGLGVGLARSLGSREEADKYFAPDTPRPHLTQKQSAFLGWYQGYFAGVRESPTSSCGPVQAIDAGAVRLAVLPINSALFCQADDDHAKLWVGRRALDDALAQLSNVDAELRVALIHHPLDWLADLERPNIKAKLAAGVDVVLRGHLHETDVEQVVSAQGGCIHFAAGAAYQTRKWPNRAMYVTLDGDSLRIFPIRYEDSPTEVWTVDPSVFPEEREYTGSVALHAPALAPRAETPESPAAAPALGPFRSNIPSRRGLPVVGRDRELDELARRLGEPARERVVVVTGPPGVGKSELAREFARRHRDRYPAGTFLINATGNSAPVELARIGLTFLGMGFPEDLPIEDQGERALMTIGAAPALLIYDNVQSFAAIERWLPRAGMPCHVVITAVAEPREPGWSVVAIDPLAHDTAVELVAALAGPQVAEAYGRELASASGGLPVQLCPAAAVLAYEVRRGRERPPDPAALAEETRASFSGVYEHVDDQARLLLHAAAGLNPQRIDRDELRSHLATALDWTEREFAEAFDACTDLHLLQGDSEATMHQLFASFLRAMPLEGEPAALIARLRDVQRERLVSIASELFVNPTNGPAAASVLGFALLPGLWSRDDAPLTAEMCHPVGAALAGIGQFEVARPWFERAVDATRETEIDGRVDHRRIGLSLHQVGYCWSSVGEFEEARRWFEQAVKEKQRGDIQGRVDHDTVGRSLHQVGMCWSSVGKFEEARRWFEQAVEEKRQGDIDGLVDHENVGSSLHEVGYCWSSIGKFEEARRWFEQAVDETRQGDIHGRVDHTSLGNSLHQVGYCWSSIGEFEEARGPFEQAVEEKRQGDIHGRVDHASLGNSLHQVGYCWSSVGKFEEARRWFEQAVEETRHGDIHGRVDHDSLGRSLHQVGYCWASAGKFEEARQWFEQAIEEAHQGDIHGRVDKAAFRTFLRSAAACFRKLDLTEEAAAYEAEARALGAREPT